MTDFVDLLEQQLVAAHGRRERFVPPWRAGIVLVAAAGAAAVIVAVVIGLASPDSQRAAPPSGQQAPPQTTPVHSVAIAVLNGTTVTGLARQAADRLTASGYHEPNVVTNDTTNQTRKVTEVFYEPGHRNEADSVAGCLDVRFDHVHAMNANARALADRADVAVFIGADRVP
jgi:negative regulator of sigma E activity